MAKAKLATVVYVSDPEHGQVVLTPDSEVPDWALPHISNPKAWVDGEVPAAASTKDDAPKSPRTRS